MIEDDEFFTGDTSGGSAMAAMAETHIFAAVDKTFGIGFGQLIEVAEVFIMALAVRVEQDIEAMVKVVKPLCIEAKAARASGANGAGIIGVRFCDEVK